MLFRKKDHSQLSDEEVLEKYKASRDKELVGILFKRYSHLAYGVCLKYLKNREESQDLVIAIFEKLFDDLLKHEINHFKSWLHRVVRNHCLMVLRKNNRPGTERDVDELTWKLEEEESEIEIKEILENNLNSLEGALLQLNSDQQTCIRLFYLEDLSYNSISEQTGFNLNQIKSHIQNGKRNLKILLSPNNEKAANK